MLSWLRKRGTTHGEEMEEKVRGILLWWLAGGRRGKLVGKGEQLPKQGADEKRGEKQRLRLAGEGLNGKGRRLGRR